MVGTWGLSGSTLTVRLLDRLTATAVRALRRDAADVVRFLALERGVNVVIEDA